MLTISDEVWRDATKVEMMCWAKVGIKKREGAPISSRGLSTRLSKGDASVANRGRAVADSKGS